MCPACLASAAWVAVGTTSAGGVVPFMVKKFLRRAAVVERHSPDGNAIDVQRTTPARLSADSPRRGR